MERPQAPAIILVIVLGLIIIIAFSVLVLRGISGYGKALRQFQETDGEWPRERWQRDFLKKRPQDVPPGLPIPSPPPPGPPYGPQSPPPVAPVSPGR